MLYGLTKTQTDLANVPNEDYQKSLTFPMPPF